MYITTTDYAVACKYWRYRPDTIFGAFHDVFVANMLNRADSEYSKVFYVKTSREEAFEAKMGHDVGVAKDPLESMCSLFNTPYILYKDDVHIVKDPTV